MLGIQERTKLQMRKEPRNQLYGISIGTRDIKTNLKIIYMA